MEGVLIDNFRIILTHLEANDLCRIATVNKEWCYESNSPILWRELFLKFVVAGENKHEWQDKDKELHDLALTTSLHHIYNDWKRAYIVKAKHNAPQGRVLCLTSCMLRAENHTPLLDKHNMGPYAHQPLMFERFSTKILEENDKLSTDVQRSFKFKSEPLPGLFRRVCTTLGDDIHRAWMVVDTSRSEELADRLSKEENAIYTSLMGSFFNLTDVHNIPYLVKVDSCSSFCEHVYNTSGGQWCYLMVEHPSLQSHTDSVWYLNIDKNLYPTKEIRTMAFLRRHLMKFYTWFDNYFRLGELQNIIMMLHIYEKSARDELFYEVLTNPADNYPFKSQVIEYYLLIGDQQKFFPEKIALIRPDFVPTKPNYNGKKEDSKDLSSQFVTFIFLLKSEKFVKRYYSHRNADNDLMPQLTILYERAKEYGFISERDVTLFFCFYYADPNFMEDPEIKPILNGSQGQDNNTRIGLIKQILISRENSKS